MPIIDPTMTSQSIGGSRYGFSGTRIEDLGASEYTLVSLICDASGSVGLYQSDMESCIKAIVEACRASPRADNLLFRLVMFNQKLVETHGFKPLSQCNPDDYSGTLRAGGSTALFDASFNAVEASNTYGKDLTSQDFDCNAIVFVITDGEDNCSSVGVAKVRDAFQRAVQQENVESLVSVLVGVGVGGKKSTLSRELKSFKDKAQFTQFIPLAQANSSTLAKLADFVSRSISAQSQSLGTGGPSTSLTF